MTHIPTALTSFVHGALYAILGVFVVLVILFVASSIFKPR